MYSFFFKWCVTPFAVVMFTLGYVMTPPSNGLANMAEAKRCEGFVVFNGERIPKCGDISK
jgi:hypothetical protein